jgi:hypothetical protein
MPVDEEFVTVYRSMDEDAQEECQEVVDVLVTAGLSPVLLDDSAPGVPVGAYEVRVPASQAAAAEREITANSRTEDLDPSSVLDVETVFEAEAGTTSELEALNVKNLLESNGIAAILVGDSILPNLGFEVKVAREHADRARRLIEVALRTGPEAAEAAERASEG